MTTGRIQALADGIFAIAATLLVLELPIPRGSSDLAGDLLHDWPAYAAYVVSFVTIAIVWINHHAQMNGVKEADRGLLELILLTLLLVAAVPWPTGLMAEYMREGEQGTVAAVVYGLVMAAMAASFTATWWYLGRHRQLLKPGFAERTPVALRRSAVGPAIYLVGVLIALIAPVGAFVIYALAAAFFAITGRRRPAATAAAE